MTCVNDANTVAEVVCWNGDSVPWESVGRHVVIITEGLSLIGTTSQVLQRWHSVLERRSHIHCSYLTLLIPIVGQDQVRCVRQLWWYVHILPVLDVEKHNPYADIGGTLYGPWMRYAILGSITISQVGFVSAYIIFVSENLQAFVLAVTNCATQLGIQYFILLQMFIFVPLALIRNLAKLSTTALVADAFILTGLIYIFGSEAGIMAKQGHAHVELFNARDWPLLIG